MEDLELEYRDYEKTLSVINTTQRLKCLAVLVSFVLIAAATVVVPIVFLEGNPF